MKTIITSETLIQFGMKENKSGESRIFPLVKQISEISEEEKEEGHTGLSICVTNLRNKAELCLNMDGAILYLCPSNIEELKIFEKCISSYEPNY